MWESTGRQRERERERESGDECALYIINVAPDSDDE